MKNVVVFIGGEEITFNDELSEYILPYAEERNFSINYFKETANIDLDSTSKLKKAELLNYICEKVPKYINEEELGEDEYVSFMGMYYANRRMAEHFYKREDMNHVCNFLSTIVKESSPYIKDNKNKYINKNA